MAWTVTRRSTSCSVNIYGVGVVAAVPQFKHNVFKNCSRWIDSRLLLGGFLQWPWHSPAKKAMVNYLMYNCFKMHFMFFLLLKKTEGSTIHKYSQTCGKIFYLPLQEIQAQLIRHTAKVDTNCCDGSNAANTHLLSYIHTVNHMNITDRKTLRANICNVSSITMLIWSKKDILFLLNNIQRPEYIIYLYAFTTTTNSTSTTMMITSFTVFLSTHQITYHGHKSSLSRQASFILHTSVVVIT